MTRITLLDGSIGQEVVKRAGETPTPLWSTQAMIDHPDLVEQVHLDYLRAGATVISTNTYAVLRDRLARVGLEDQMGALTDAAIAAAQRARVTCGRGRIAGVVGPLVQSYRPDLSPPAPEAAQIYAEPVAHLKDQVDLLLLETMASVDQAEGSLRAASGQGLPVWLAVTVDDADGSSLRSGEPLADLAPLVAHFRPDALLINCSRPEVIAPALEVLKTFGLPFGAYANGFTAISEGFLQEAPTVDALSARHDLGPEAYADFIMDWIAQGATIVGGCCEVGPEHIRAMAHKIRQAGHEII
ncbi:homocysteine S-methyltransferase family protein [Roseovarius sp. A21]|uniref:Homocysteine S-methyltransferase family protein n=1 Tax=Roseovarius bejariae TaxID=2576383 RepID=A0A844CSN1_9RHOB|nr:homocysteine S-methyltransferase family protein [Roseovarius bejariae]MRU16465.1 homocysteine S-methyltransferase family protein [Roseovarius bejariae]